MKNENLVTNKFKLTFIFNNIWKFLSNNYSIENKIISDYIIDSNNSYSLDYPVRLYLKTLQNENYTNDLEAYGWGFGFRTLMNPIKNNNLGSVGEFGWAGAASTYFLVDNEKKMKALLMTQVLSGNHNLKKDFYKFIYYNF